MSSKFAFAAATVKAKGDVSTTPELTVTGVKDKFRLNSAMSRKFLLQDGDRLMFVSNEDAIIAAGIEYGSEEFNQNLAFGICKGVVRKDTKGNPVQELKRLNKAEKEALAAGEYKGEVDEEGRPIEPAFTGFKLASNNHETGYGRVLEGSDASRWALLGGTTETHKVYGIAEEAVTVEVEGETLEAYPLEFLRDEEKLVKKAPNKGKATSTEEDASPSIVD